MSTRLSVALAAYLALWAAIAGGMIYGIGRAGHYAWVAVASAFLLFLSVNGSLAYRARVRQLGREGKESPRYLHYLFFPQGLPKFGQDAPRSSHLLVGIATAVTGVFFVFCGAALAFDAEWSRISQPLFAAAICIVLASFGLALLYLAWRLLSFGRQYRAYVA